LAQTAERFASGRRRRRSADEVRRQTRVLHRYREKSTALNTGTVANQSAFRACSSEFSNNPVKTFRCDDFALLNF
jgi:hypothetical protein